MARLSGWQRLWIVVSVLYLAVVAVLAYWMLPSVETTAHTDDFYTQLSPDARSKLILKHGVVFDSEVGAEGQMPNGHRLLFRKAVTPEQQNAVGREYFAILERATTERRTRTFSYAFLVWLGPCIALYLSGWAIGWVYRGFRSKPNHVP